MAYCPKGQSIISEGGRRCSKGQQSLNLTAIVRCVGVTVQIAPKGNTANHAPLPRKGDTNTLMRCSMKYVHGDSFGNRALLRCVALALLAMVAVVAATPVAAQRGTIRQGLLTCRMSASVGLVIGSRQRLACQFKSDRGATQNYTGTIGRLGLDIGVTAGGVMVWAVLASTANMPPRALAGEFVGASGDISLGVGVGANVLLGGARKSISLQPLSVEGQVGANLALGVARMTLSAVN